MTSFDVIVVGAGPAGMAAAASAAQQDCGVCLIDDNAQPGGQIWRSKSVTSGVPYAKQFEALQQKLQSDRIERRSETRVIDGPSRGILRVESAGGTQDLRYGKLILATGARERLLPFPGWTLPGVMGAGGLQAMVKGGMPIAGKRVIIGGTGPLLLAVAANLVTKGARVIGIYEQAPLARMLAFGARLWRYASKLRDGLAYRLATRSAPYRNSSWVISAEGDTHLKSVTVATGGSARTLDCDYLGCGFHLVPNLELPSLMGCRIESSYVLVNKIQQTSVEDIYCVGEPTGIGGLEKSLCEGEIAGLAATDRPAAHLFPARDRHARFARELDRAFALRSELKGLVQPETLVCRCEDVPFRALVSVTGWREAKLHTRCGMGPCQGRVCGPATEYLFGWNSSHARPPVFPARIATLAIEPNAAQAESPSSAT